MSSNETFAEAIAAVRKMIHDCPAIKSGLGEFRYQLKANGAIDRIEAANKREVAGLVANLDALEKAMGRVCSMDEIAEIIAIKKEIQNGNR